MINDCPFIIVINFVSGKFEFLTPKTLSFGAKILFSLSLR